MIAMITSCGKRSLLHGIGLFLACLLFCGNTHAVGGITTAEIVTQTAQAIPSCMQYQVKGACFWLKCVFIKCSVEVSVRITHFAPDVTISVFHDPLQHPWTDFGAVVTKAASGIGSTILGLPLDSAGTRYRDDRTARNRLFRDADAIGNPLLFVSFMKGGGSSSSAPSSVTVPNANEMMKFPSTIGSVMSEWSNVPSNVSASVVSSAKSMANLSDTASSVSSAFSSLGGKLSSALDGQSINVDNANSSNGGANSGGSGNSNGGSGSGGMGSQNFTLFCPPAASPFSLYFQSHLDAYTWRSVLPAELLYPGSWIPGMRELGSFPANTWSGIYPRDGSVTQQHVVKGPAVIAQRVGDIITRRAQPHIYALLSIEGEANGVRYFHDPKVWESDGNTTWQRLYPHGESSCSAFGQNDTVSPASWGDGNTSSEEGYMWNMWRRYDCCEKVGQIFLFTVP